MTRLDIDAGYNAGFNISMVAQYQVHGPQVLTRHYSNSRASVEKKAADHVGRVVHGRGRPHLN
ncbi:MAG TPA: hypothetical protein VKQ71_03965 [Acidimicrobiales bacterium]|nr:hypothetical protein [Acidimicrobiales bacterium]